VKLSIPLLIQRNEDRWRAMHLRADRIAQFDATARRLCAADAKVRFLALSAATGVPWFVIAVIAEREAGGPPSCWTRQLAQGDPLDRPSVNDPAGRGPFLSHADDTVGNDAWHRAGLDALVDCAPRLARWRDWTVGGALTALEEMNGLGYAMLGVPSAYVWSGSDQYVSGKYVADHVYRRNVVDVQEGCAPLISRMMALDPTIKFAA
jgi:lysozyme family protein